jgi:saccharopine dehydrogenase-like NADP-dependent oxidoreductase
MYKTFVAGAGIIGTLIATLLANSGDYEVFLVDKDITHLNLPTYKNLSIHQLDVTDSEQLNQFIQLNHIEITISSLPFFHNIFIATAAALFHLHYFDLTEDIYVADQVRRLAYQQETAFVSQCGVAPGFINIIANDIISQFDTVEATYLRAGCLPKNSNHPLLYASTWSLDGLINEYANTCYGLINGQKVSLQPLGDLETIELDGNLYEAFNTSGGIGSLVDSYQNQVQILNYKTLRYPGHCEKMHFLLHELQLNKNRAMLKQILETSLPRTQQDIMLLYVSVIGEKGGSYCEQNYVKKIEPRELYGRKWLSIQLSTASSLCAIVDLVLSNVSHYRGFILQEQFPLTLFLNNRFGNIYSL